MKTEADSSERNRLQPIERSISDGPGPGPAPGPASPEEVLELDLLDEFEEGNSSEEERIFATIVLPSTRLDGASTSSTTS
jgi:hypothetical protein